MKASFGRGPSRGVMAAVAVVLLVYAWVVSAGTWTRWPTYTAYHQKLAAAFRSGQLHLHDQPDPRLLALPDPYDPVQNKPYRLHDASLYDGKYHLYWGPVPALFLVAANTFVRVPHVPDQVLTFAFAAAGVVMTSLLLVRVRRRHFPDVPGWTVPLAVLAVGLAAPAPFMLGRAAVYEASIAASQAFLLAGLYAAVRAVDDEVVRRGWLALGGVLLACAVGSRASTAGPALVIAAMTVWSVRRQSPAQRRAPLGALLALGVPLAAAVVALAAYNHARFGSAFEVGIRYQLAAFNSHAAAHQLTSAANVPPNLHAYLLRTPVIFEAFPFFIPRPGVDANAFPACVPVPSFYIAEEATAGLLVVTPFSWFALVAVGGVVISRLRGSASSGGNEPAGWLVLTLTLCAAAAAVPALVLALSSVRYQADWTSFVLILATIGFWSGHRRLTPRPRAQRVWRQVAFALALITVLLGPLLAVTSTFGHFRKHNPELLERLERLTA